MSNQVVPFSSGDPQISSLELGWDALEKDQRLRLMCCIRNELIRLRKEADADFLRKSGTGILRSSWSELRSTIRQHIVPHWDAQEKVFTPLK